MVNIIPSDSRRSLINFSDKPRPTVAEMLAALKPTIDANNFMADAYFAAVDNLKRVNQASATKP